MDDEGFIDITAEKLKDYIETHREDGYLLVDVRQTLEYELGHIPGATFLPLPNLEARLFELPGDKDLIFYCRNGTRSLMAASLAAEGEVTGKKVYNLLGGIFAFEGRTLTGIPKVQMFDRAQSLEALLHTAMDLEKGAWRFYSHLKKSFAGAAIGPTVDRLSKEETAHARLIYRFWVKTAAAAVPFETLFDRLPGEILEGGDTLEDMLARVDELEGDPCLGVIEIALQIEHAAFDLYRTLSGQVESQEAREALLSLAQAEKGHMRALARAIVKCPAS